MKLDITEQMLFALLRSALHATHADATIFAGITSEAWQECYRLSVRQGVMALAWDGLITLPTELQPPKSLKINWWLAVLLSGYIRFIDILCHTRHHCRAIKRSGVCQ